MKDHLAERDEYFKSRFKPKCLASPRHAGSAKPSKPEAQAKDSDAANLASSKHHATSLPMASAA
jgi:hypothetical protein